MSTELFLISFFSVAAGTGFYAFLLDTESMSHRARDEKPSVWLRVGCAMGGVLFAVLLLLGLHNFLDLISLIIN